MLTMLRTTAIRWATFLVVLPIFDAEFNPFSDSIPFDINWPGPLIDQGSLTSHTIIPMMTQNHEKYQCLLPINYMDEMPKAKEDISNYHGPSEEELLQPLFQQKSCSYRIDKYWSYELCHARHIRQYHERKEAHKPLVITEFYLGKAQDVKPPAESSARDDESSPPVEHEVVAESSPKPPRKITTKRVDNVELAYFEYNMSDGTPCDLTNQPRKASLHYICQPEGNGEIYELKETSTCEYELTILSSQLCKHPSYKPKNTPVTKIDCHPVDGAPNKPRNLVKIDSEREEFQRQSRPFRKVQYRVVPKATPKETPPAQQSTQTVISAHTDTQLLRQLLSGDYCLKGGIGWWKYEFCFGKFAQQFHEENGKRTNILLGKWDKAKHLEFLRKHPQKQHKPHQKSLNLYYTGGDICDLTGEHRNVEVRLRCKDDSQHPHAVSLFLLEPSVCQYVLGVESPILCQVIERADENGIVQTKDLP